MGHSPHFSRTLPADGTIRQLRPSDLPRFKAHLLRLDSAGRRDRFNGPTSDAFIEAYAARCFSDGTAVIGFVRDGHVLGAAELHERPQADVATGEIAFSVESEWQRHGLGGRLFGLLIQNARWLGYERLLVTTHPQNLAMKRLAARFEAALRFVDGETVGIIELGGPELPLSVAVPRPILRV